MMKNIVRILVKHEANLYIMFKEEKHPAIVKFLREATNDG